MNLKELMGEIERLQKYSSKMNIGKVFKCKQTRIACIHRLNGIKQTVEAINWTEGPLNRKGYEEWQKIKELLGIK